MFNKIKMSAMMIAVAFALTAMPVVANPDKKDIVDTAVGAGSFNTLVAAVKAAGLVEALKGTGPFTVFAPTDEAFAKVPKAALEALLADKEALKKVLFYHVVAGNVMAKDVVTLKEAKTLQGSAAKITIKDGKVMVDNANVVKTDIACTNGVIHVIDSVILPPAEEAAAPGTIVDVAVADGRFTTLVAAVQAAGLAETLSGEGPFTVFAPTDDAFAKLPAGTLDELLKPESKQALTDILFYHVASGKVSAADVMGLTSAPTVLGKDVNISLKDGNVFLNDTVQVIITDIQESAFISRRRLIVDLTVTAAEVEGV